MGSSDDWPHPKSQSTMSVVEEDAAGGLGLAYKVDGKGLPRVEVPVAAVRSYELRLLRHRPRQDLDGGKAGVCGQDERKQLSETEVGRKSAGMLVAVTPCLQVVRIAPMYAAESVTQVVLFARAVQETVPNVTHVCFSGSVKRRWEVKDWDTRVGWLQRTCLREVFQWFGQGCGRELPELRSLALTLPR